MTLELLAIAPRVSPSSGAKAATRPARRRVGVGGGVGDHRIAVGMADGKNWAGIWSRKLSM